MSVRVPGAGISLRRLEDDILVAGRGGYVDDLRLDAALHGAVLRSPYPHAEIRRIETNAARAAPGVQAVYAAADLRAAGIGTIPYQTLVAGPDGEPVRVPEMPVLAEGRVRYVGQPVAFVVAESAHAAREAAELIAVEYDALPHVVDARLAAAAAAPVLYPEIGTNVVARYTVGDAAACDAAFEAAAHIVALTVGNNRLAPSPMEPRGCVGAFDRSSGELTLAAPKQAPHLTRDILADSVFHLSHDKVVVRVPTIGGGFGAKLTPYPEDVLVLHAARDLGRPVRWTAERSECLIADWHGRDHQCDIALAFDSDFRIVALRIEDFGALGAYPTPFGIPIATTTGNRVLTTVYDVPLVHLVVDMVVSNAAPSGPYRGAGRPEVNFRMERIMEVAATRLGIDPVELRRRNLVPSDKIPYASLSGQTYDSGDFPRVLDRALALADWPGFAARKRASEREGRLRGRGLACHIDTTSGVKPTEAVVAEAHGDGRIVVRSGTQEMGQGLKTTYAQMVSAMLGLAPETIEIVQGDTSKVASGVGSYGSRSLFLGGSAVVGAVEALIERLKTIAGARFEAAIEDIVVSDGILSVAGTDRRIAIAALCATTESGLVDATAEVSAPFCFPNGCYVCEIEIDPETGEVSVERMTCVDDYGTVINPMLVEGQIHGGVAQGIGQALLEHVHYDEESGQPLTGSFMDYALPRADEVPAIASGFFPDAPARTNPLGAKGAGESGALGAPPAVVNAILDALRPFGIVHLDMPIRSEDVWRAIASSPRRSDRTAP